MRYLVAVLSMWMLVGCHNQTSSFSNPFLPPDRVPPPSTLQLTPGTAQPYYPGGSVQPAPPVAGQTLPPGTFGSPPATSGQAPPLMPTSPAAPSSGWNGSPQPAPGSATRTPVYGGQTTSAYTPGPPATHSLAVQSVASSMPTPQVPAQTILPAQYQVPVVTGSTTTSNSNPAATVAQNGVPQRPVVRTLTAAELQPTSGTSTLAVDTGGFQTPGNASLASGPVGVGPGGVGQPITQ